MAFQYSQNLATERQGGNIIHPYAMFSNQKEGNQISTFVTIGANLPDLSGRSALQTCEAACNAIAQLPGLSQPLRSQWYCTAPLPASDQPDYINGIMRVQCNLAPADLLAALQAIESRMGRVRTVPNAARILDLDIIDMDGLVRSAPDPVLPHLRAHLRAFVLLPLRDVAPAWVHPVLGRSVVALLDGLTPQDVRPLWRG